MLLTASHSPALETILGRGRWGPGGDLGSQAPVCCSLTFCFCSCCLDTLLVQGQDGSDGEPQGVFTGWGGRGFQPGTVSPALPRAESWCPLPTVLRPVCNVLTDIWKWGREKPFFAFLPVGRGGCHIWLLEERCLICLLSFRHPEDCELCPGLVQMASRLFSV